MTRRRSLYLQSIASTIGQLNIYIRSITKSKKYFLHPFMQHRSNFAFIERAKKYKVAGSKLYPETIYIRAYDKWRDREKL